MRGTGGYTEPKLPSKEVVADLFKSGASVHEIAIKYGCDNSAVYLKLGRAGIQPPGRTTRFFKDKNAATEIISMYHSGMGGQAIARKIGTSPSVVYNCLIRHKISRRRSAYGQGRTILCEDGHVVRSEIERAVDNWLFCNNIVHAYEWPLPFGTGSADFFAHGVYIEVWGVEHRHKYEKRKNQKLSEYALAGVRLIQIQNSDIDHLDLVLSPLKIRTNPLVE